MPQSKTWISLWLLAASAGGCFFGTSPTVAPDVTAEQQARASRSMGLSFPPQTRFLLYHRAKEGRQPMPMPDDHLHLKIELPASELAGFLAQAPLASAQWSSTDSWIPDMPNWPQWQPSKIQKFRFADFELPGHDGLGVLIDDDQSDPKQVYLLWLDR